MPLRDRIRPPVWKLASWEGFHGMSPAIIVQRLDPLLPSEYPLTMGQPLPKLLIWLTGELNVMLDLETSLAETCRVLRIS